MDSTAVVRPLPGSGLAARVGDLLLVCVDTGPAVAELLGLVEEGAALGGDGGVLVRRVAALLASDYDGRFPACAASGPLADGRLAVLVHGAATADVVGGDGTVWFLHGSELHAWRADGTLERLAKAPKPLDDFGEAGAHHLVAFANDTTIYAI